MSTRKGYLDEVISWDQDAWKKRKDALANEINAEHERNKVKHELGIKDVLIGDDGIDRAGFIFAWNHKASQLDARIDELSQKFSKRPRKELVETAANLHAIADLLVTGLLILGENQSSTLKRLSPTLDRIRDRVGNLATGRKVRAEQITAKAAQDYAVVKLAVDAAIKETPDRAEWTAKAMTRYLEKLETFSSPYPASRTLRDKVEEAMKPYKKP